MFILRLFRSETCSGSDAAPYSFTLRAKNQAPDAGCKRVDALVEALVLGKVIFDRRSFSPGPPVSRQAPDRSHAVQDIRLQRPGVGLRRVGTLCEGLIHGENIAAIVEGIVLRMEQIWRREFW